MSFSLRTLKKVVRRDMSSLWSMVSSPLMSSKLKRSSMSSESGVSPYTNLTSVFTTSGNSPFVNLWFLSVSNLSNIFYSNLEMSSSFSMRAQKGIFKGLQYNLTIYYNTNRNGLIEKPRKTILLVHTGSLLGNKPYYRSQVRFSSIDCHGFILI